MRQVEIGSRLGREPAADLGFFCAEAGSVPRAHEIPENQGSLGCLFLCEELSA